MGLGGLACLGNLTPETLSATLAQQQQDALQQLYGLKPAPAGTAANLSAALPASLGSVPLAMQLAQQPGGLNIQLSQ